MKTFKGVACDRIYGEQILADPYGTGIWPANRDNPLAQRQAVVDRYFDREGRDVVRTTDVRTYLRALGSNVRTMCEQLAYADTYPNCDWSSTEVPSISRFDRSRLARVLGSTLTYEQVERARDADTRYFDFASVPRGRSERFGLRGRGMPKHGLAAGLAAKYDLGHVPNPMRLHAKLWPGIDAKVERLLDRTSPWQPLSETIGFVVGEVGIPQFELERDIVLASPYEPVRS